MIYQWGSRSFSVSAQLVGETVTQLSAENGGVCPPSALVEASRPADAPTHSLFTWDDPAAAEAWRRQQARDVIRSIKIVTDDEDNAKTPAFVHVSLVDSTGPREGYSAIMDVIVNDEQREQVLAEARRYLNGFRRRYRHLQELQPVFEAIESLGAVAS